MTKKRVAVSLRKPPSDLDAFVAGVARQVEATRTSEGRLVTTGVGARRELVIYLPPELARKLSIRCVEQGRDASDVVAELLSAGLPDEEPAAADAQPWANLRTILAVCRAHLPSPFGKREPLA